MTSKIDDFKAAFESGFARANRYKIIFPNGPEKLSIICDSATWPGRQILTSDRVTNINQTKVAYSFDQEDLTVSFILGNDWLAWEYLDNWQNDVIRGLENVIGFEVNYKSDYTRGDVVLQHLDTNNLVRKEVTFKNVFPTTLNSIELGNANTGDVIRVTATFSYDNWETTR